MTSSPGRAETLARHLDDDASHYDDDKLMLRARPRIMRE